MKPEGVRRGAEQLRVLSNDSFTVAVRSHRSPTHGASNIELTGRASRLCGFCHTANFLKHGPIDQGTFVVVTNFVVMPLPDGEWGWGS
jgi:hypothetical protein